MVKIETIPHADGDVWYSVRGNCDDSPHDGRFRFYVLCSYSRRHNTCPVYDGA